jgi:transketolase C-terminal domain/subunit
MVESEEIRDYRRRGRECVDMAAKISECGHKLFLLEMARAWMKLAETVEHRAADVVFVSADAGLAERP